MGSTSLVAKASNIKVQANQVIGLSPQQDASRYVAEFTGRSVAVGTNASHTLELDSDLGPLMRATTDLQISAGGFFYVAGSEIGRAHV